MAFKFKLRGGDSSRRNKSRKGALTSGEKGGSGCLVLFGLVFGGAGLAAAYFIGTMFVETVGTYSWDKAPAELQSCEVAVDKSNQDGPFSLDVRYRYTIDGSSYEGTRYRLNEDTESKYAKLARKRRDLLESGDGGIVAYVDPDDRQRAILQRENLWLTGLMLLFPVPFLWIGFGMVYAVLRQKFGGKTTDDKKEKRKADGSLSSAAKVSKAGTWVGRIAFSLLLLGGIGAAFPLLINPIKTATAAKSWPEVPCKIIWSRVLSHDSDDGTTYSVDIFYEYEFDGQTWKSNRYGMFSGSSSGRAGKKEIVNRYPHGSMQTCWVNPDDPIEALLKRELGFSILLGLIPTFLILIGGIGAWFSWRSKGTAKAGRSKDANLLYGGSRASSHALADADVSSDPMAPQVFKPGGKRLVGFFVALGIALFWNGIVSVFVYQAVQGFRRGNPEWFLTIFMIPFVLIGLLMILAVFYTLMMQFNPKPVLTVTPGSPTLGDTLRVSWRLRTGSGRLRHLRVLLVGREKATYRQGTNTRTDTKTFYRRVLAEAEHGIDLVQGEGRIDLPLDLCPTLDLGNNEIEWSVKVEGQIPRWPDVDDRYVITVRPVET